MKKPSKANAEVSDDLRPEYRFDYATARRNPYARRLRGHVVAVILDPEVAAAFPTSESVNKALRSVMGVVPRRSTRRLSKTARVRPKTQARRTEPPKARRRGARR